MMNERMSHAITSWLPISAVAAGIAMMAGSLLNLPAANSSCCQRRYDLLYISHEAIRQGEGMYGIHRRPGESVKVIHTG
jgi:hypothetical protein